MGLNDMRLPHVSHPEQEAQMTVSLTNDGVAAEEKRLRPFLGARQLGEHDAHHEGLYHHSNYTLQTHNEDCLWTLLSRMSRPVPAT
jgi:hypothetical protein